MKAGQISFQLRIVRTDEATFKCNGQVNIHNPQNWSATNPHWLSEVGYQHMWNLNATSDVQSEDHTFFKENLIGAT